METRGDRHRPDVPRNRARHAQLHSPVVVLSDLVGAAAAVMEVTQLDRIGLLFEFIGSRAMNRHPPTIGSSDNDFRISPIDHVDERSGLKVAQLDARAVDRRGAGQISIGVRHLGHG